MNKNKEYNFTLEDTSFPLIFSYYTEIKGTGDPSLDIKYRIQAHIISSEKIKILFGSQVSHGKLKQEENPLTVRVEILGTFKFQEKIFNDTNKITKVNSIKPLPNMLAILFPFIREKHHSLLYNNKIIFYLPPQNTIELVKNLKDSIKIVDERKNQVK